jgi:hypothetical protein
MHTRNALPANTSFAVIHLPAFQHHHEKKKSYKNKAHEDLF